MRTKQLPKHRKIQTVILIVIFLAGCSAPVTPAPPSIIPLESPTVASTPVSTSTPRADGLTADEAATLDSLVKIDDYPLYTMRYHGSYDLPGSSGSTSIRQGQPADWACSLFAVLGNEDNMLYGRNFDWHYSPAVLLYTNPSDGYASASMVDIAYLGFDGPQAADILELPLVERRSLLDAPYLPFDGMNEAGLVIGMAAVPAGGMRPDPAKETVDSLGIIRLMLDRAANVDEALDIIRNYNIDMEGGPPLHYLVADASGVSILLEFYRGEMVVIPAEQDWHAATNFLQSSAGDSITGQCSRYDQITTVLSEAEGQLNAADSMGLLQDVSQVNTQWSIIYGITSMQIRLVMGQQYDQVHSIPFDFGED